MPKVRVAEWAGDWAIVTGASAGIGREFCRELGRVGLNIAMIARRAEALRELAAEIEDKYRVRAVPIVIDLTVPDGPTKAWEAFLAADTGRLRLLVNNAGCGQWGPFDTSLSARYDEIIRLNCCALVGLTAAALPALQSTGCAAIINVSSQAAYQPVPYMSAYAATKAFVHSFSQALHGELAESGILVQTLVPGPTRTEFDEKAGAYETGQKLVRGAPQLVACRSLAALATGRAVVTCAEGVWRQRLFAALFSPEFVIRQVAKMFRPPSQRITR